MRNSSSRSASSIYEDREAILEALRTLAEAALERHPELVRVVLFGSLARDDYGLYSDADLLLVLERSEERRWFDRIPDFLLDFNQGPVPVEVFPYTEEELRRMDRSENMLVRRMLREGQVMAERE